VRKEEKKRERKGKSAGGRENVNNKYRTATERERLASYNG